MCLKVKFEVKDNDTVIVSAVRTPFGRFGGSLTDFDGYELSATVMKGLLERTNLEPHHVEEIYWGVGDTSFCKDVYTPVLARQALLKAGFPPETVSLSLDTACCSAMTAVHLASNAINCQLVDMAIAGGVTIFSKTPLILRNLRWKGTRIGNMQMEDPLWQLGYKDYNPVAVDTGEVALEHGITREEQDRWAYQSHKKYGQAYTQGKFREEIIPLEVADKDPSGKPVGKRALDVDEQYRPNAALEALAKLPTIYGSPTVTAGNAPGLNDGATGILVASRAKAEELNLKPLAKIVATARIALSPRLLAEAPAPAIMKALTQANLSIDELDLIEINEAFAAQPLVATKILAEKYYGGNIEKLMSLREKTNVNGGAIAIGHPNTASGARIIMTLLYELRRRRAKNGVAAICGGLAQGEATIIETELK